MRNSIAWSNTWIRACLLTASVSLLACAGQRAGGDVLYVSDAGSQSIKKVDSTGAITTFTTNVGVPQGLAFTSAGNLYEFDASTTAVGSINEFTPTGSRSTPVPQTGGVYALALDASDNLYFAIFGIDRLAPDGTLSKYNRVAQSDWRFSAIGGMAFDASGNLFISSSRDSLVGEFSPDGTVKLTSLGGNLFGLQGMAFDAAGNMYVACDSIQAILRISPQGTVSTFATAGLDGPVGLAFDSSGSLYVANDGNGTIEKFSADGQTATQFATGLNHPHYLAFTDNNGQRLNTLNYPTLPAPEPTCVGFVGVLGVALTRRARRGARHLQNRAA